MRLIKRVVIEQKNYKESTIELFKIVTMIDHTRHEYYVDYGEPSINTLKTYTVYIYSKEVIDITGVIIGIFNSRKKTDPYKREYQVQGKEGLEKYRRRVLSIAKKYDENAYVDLLYKKRLY